MPKQYERIELLDRAVELFRKQGFNGTSTAELVDALGVNRKSMYAEFGSKQGLFEAALERYDRHHLSRVLGPLEASSAGLDAIRRAFEGYASAIDTRFAGLGCLMCNTAVERGALDPEIGRFVDAYLKRLTEAFRAALVQARTDGDIDPATDVDEVAGFLTTTLVGIAASVRARAPSAQVWAAHRMVERTLEGLGPC